MEEPLIQLNGWKTIKDLAKEKGCTTQYLSKLVRQGKLKAISYPELNQLKLVTEQSKNLISDEQRTNS